jgi:LmbE family N-acetylglucosaminyl deacetylase
MPASPLTHIYLSPHLDDAVFSCGALISRQARAGHRVVVVTVCTGNPPPGPLSPLALELHQRWVGQTSPTSLPAPAEVTAARRREDLDALEMLNAQAVHLDVPDCIYRHNPATGWAVYATESSIFGALHTSDLPLVRRVANKLSTLLRGFGRHHLYSPLGIGHHVDHQLARRAVESAGGIYGYYEDYPYVNRAGSRWPDRHSPLLEGKSFNPELIRLEPEDLDAQLDAMARYKSQIGSFWPDSSAMAEAVRAFAADVGSGQPASRLWRVGG